MDYLENIGSQLSQITAYDVKDAFQKAKGMVMNYTEYEQKVREATNNDAWGASSTLMQDIAQATFNFQLFNEIMPTIYKRYTDKEARQWRQIYKALQLLEYLVKHGSERVVDDARTHMSLIKMLRNFHYIDDQTGKDQGINVRNRSRELCELLGDLDRVRQERRKAKATKNKYVGTGSGGGIMPGGFSSGSGSRYGGFGSESLGYGGDSSWESSGGGGGGGGGGSFRDSSRNNNEYDEYDAGDFDERPSSSSGTSSRARTSQPARSSSTPAASKPASEPKPEPPKPAKAVNLFDFEDDEPAPASNGSGGLSAPPASTPSAASASLDDDFDDFQAAPGSAPAAVSTASAPAPTHASKASGNLFDLLSSEPSAPQQSSMPSAAPLSMASASTMSSPIAQQQPIPFSQPFTSNPTSPSLMAPMNAAPNRPTSTSSTTISGNSRSGSAPPQKASTVNFDDLWASSLGSTTSKPTNAANQGNKGLSMAALRNQQASAGIWSGAQSGGTNNAGFGGMGNSGSGGKDDLLM